ncbi:MAG: multidrug effflux MFS transporter [Bdellovibrionota bacterium]
MKKVSGVFLWIIFLIALINPLASDIHVPALPEIANAFQSKSVAQLTISLYFLGLAMGQIICGPLSDYYGRRRVLLCGFVIAECGSFLCVVASDPVFLNVARFLQGFGIAAASTLFAVILRDVCDINKYAKIMSYMSLSITIIPPIAPVLGSSIQYLFGWRPIFILLAVVILIVAMLSFFLLQETNLNTYKEKKSFKKIVFNYFELLQNKKFLAYTLCAACSYSGFIAYCTISPFVFQNTFGLTAVQYAWLATVIFVCSLLSRLFNSFLLSKFSVNQMIAVGIFLMLASSSFALMINFLHVASVTTILISSALFIGGGGFIYSNSLAGTMQISTNSSGTIMSLYSFLQILGTFITGTVVSVFFTSSSIMLAFIFTALSLIAGISFYIFIIFPQSVSVSNSA